MGPSEGAAPNAESPSTPGGDHDQPYTFGRHPITYLSEHEYTRLQLSAPRLRRDLEDIGNPDLEASPEVGGD